MKAMICPICGKVIQMNSEDGRYWHKGEKLIEVIPLVTPQEIRTVHGSITPEWFREWEKEQGCPELKKICGGDEIGYICKLIDKWCLRESGQKCEEYDRIMKEMEDESREPKAQVA